MATKSAGLVAAEVRRKPQGGYRFITVTELCMSWALYREGRLSARGLRAYFAAHEMVARRCVSEPKRSPHYRLEELGELLGGSARGKVAAAVRELEGLGLIVLESGSVRFATTAEDLVGCVPACLHTMLAEFKRPERAVPIPRRVLRMLAGRAGRGLVATTLGHLLRCMRFLRGRGCVTAGLCRPRWVADVFGVSLASVKAAREELEREGLLIRDETPRWVRRRWGSRINVNPLWCEDGDAVSPEACPKSSPSKATFDPKSGLTDSELEPSSTYKNQEPALRRPAGLSGKGTKTKAPRLEHVEGEDLRSIPRLTALYEQAVEARLATDSESAFNDFVALAERAKRVGRDPAAVFVSLLRRGDWRFIANQDEDQALRRVRAHRDVGREPMRAEVRRFTVDPEEVRRSELRRQLAEVLRAERAGSL